MEKINKLTARAALVILFATTSLPVIAQQPRPEVSALMTIAAEKADTLETSPEARRELAITVQALIGRRISTNVLGYEQNKEYLGDLDSVYVRFSSALDKSKEAHLAFTSPEFRDLTLTALSINDSEFQNFYTRTLSKDPVLQSKSPSEIKYAMVIFSALMFSSDTQLWRSASKKSYFWPVCRKKSG